MDRGRRTDSVIAPRRLCRTDDGRIVPDGHPEAAFLVVGVGAEVPAEFEDAVTAYLSTSGAKQAAPPANKAVDAPDADKAAAPAKKTSARK